MTPDDRDFHRHEVEQVKAEQARDNDWAPRSWMTEAEQFGVDLGSDR